MRRLLCLTALILSVATPFMVTLSSRPAFADSYAIYHVGNGDSEAVYGLTDSGVAVLYGLENCGIHSMGSCYSIWNNGLFTGTSSTAPVLSYDNGSACRPALPAGVSLQGASRCNGGFGAAGGDSSLLRGLFVGPLGSLTFLRSGSADQLAVDALGDVLWTDGRDELNFEAIDLTSRTAPEPSSLALLGTGVLAVAEMLRRRLVRA